MGAYVQTVYQRYIDEIDSDNVVALTAHFKYTPSELSFISFSRAVFPGKNITNCLTIHDSHSPEHQNAFVVDTIWTLFLYILHNLIRKR
jgi:hypothetical protein